MAKSRMVIPCLEMHALAHQLQALSIAWPPAGHCSERQWDQHYDVGQMQREGQEAVASMKVWREALMATLPPPTATAAPPASTPGGGAASQSAAVESDQEEDMVVDLT